MRSLLSECPLLTSARHWFSSTMTTSSLYPVSSTCKPSSEVCFNSCSPNSKFPKADSSYVLNGNISNNYNFYTCHLQPGSTLPSKSPYNVSTYWLYSFSPTSGPQSASSSITTRNSHCRSHLKFGKHKITVQLTHHFNGFGCAHQCTFWLTQLSQRSWCLMMVFVMVDRKSVLCSLFTICLS